MRSGSRHCAAGGVHTTAFHKNDVQIVVMRHDTEVPVPGGSDCISSMHSFLRNGLAAHGNRAIARLDVGHCCYKRRMIFATVTIIAELLRDEPHHEHPQIPPWQTGHEVLAGPRAAAAASRSEAPGLQFAPI